jgi:hypothetical protein
MKFWNMPLIALCLIGCKADEETADEHTLDGSLLSNGGSVAIEIVADGSFDPNVAPPDLPNAQMTAIPGRWTTDYVYTEILGWTPAEIEADEQAASDFFQTYYGFDPMDLALEGRLVYEDTVLDPRAGFRVAMASNFLVSGGGLPAWNLSKIAMSTDENGIQLGGTHGNGLLMAGEAIQFGAYVFESEMGLHRVAYWTLRPVIENQGALVWTCEVASDDFGEGIAQGLAVLTVDAAGIVEADIRNHVTFW